MGKRITGGCIQIWRQEPLDTTFRDLLRRYAAYLNKVAVSFTIRFVEPVIETKQVEAQIIKAIGYIPKEEIVICGFSDVIFESAYEIMIKFGSYLRVGVTRELIPKTKGKAYQIKYYDIVGISKIPRYYHILDCEFVSNYFAVGQDPARRQLFSLDRYSIYGLN